jgi:hypothetical protein
MLRSHASEAFEYLPLRAPVFAVLAALAGGPRGGIDVLDCVNAMPCASRRSGSSSAFSIALVAAGRVELMLFERSTREPALFGVVALAHLGTANPATVAPARRACGLKAGEALRAG